MNLLDAFIVLTLVAAMGSALVVALTGRRLGAPGARFLGLVFAGTALWCGSYAMELLSTSLDAKVFWAKVAYIGIVVVPPSWFLFVESYLGEHRPRLAPLLYAIPLVTLAFVTLAPGVPWVWNETYLVRNGGVTTLAVEYGPWFWVHTAYSYLCLAAGSALLVVGIFRRARGLSAQGVLIAAAALLPWLVNALAVFEVVSFDNLDPTAPAMAVSMLLIVLGLLRLQVLEVFPSMVSIAHETVLREMQDGVIVTDERCRIIDANPAAARLVGSTKPLAGGNIAAWVDLCLDGEDGCAKFDAAARLGGRVRAVAPHRTGVDLEGVVSTMGQIGRHRGYALVLRDVTQHEATTRALAESEERLRVVIDQSPVAVLAFGKDLTITECNGLLGDMLGGPREGLVGKEITPRSVPDLYELCRVALEGETSSYEGTIGREGGDEHWMQCRVSPLYDGGAIAGGMCVAWDVTGAKRAEALIEALAFRDTLTGLPNRSLYRDRLRQAVEEAQANGSRVAAGILGLDRFKTVSEAMGHGVADELLQHLAGRLETLVRRGDTVARVAGDELAFIMPNLTDASLRRLGEEILTAVREPVNLGARSLTVTGSLGLALYPGDAADAYELLENAQRALARARDGGGDRHRVYDLSMNLEAAERLDIEQGLRKALDEQQLVVYYEPQVNLENGSILGVEALVRWNHPTRGLLPPAMFIPVAEESGLISRLGEWVLRQACSEMVAFAAESGIELRLAVNLSPMELRGADLPRNVARILAETGFNPSRLDIELTETAVIADFEATRGALEELRALGVSVVLDDFGTGYASLTHLHGLPIDKVKVDRSFVMRCEEDGDAASIVAALISLAHTLKLGVVAEGVEAVGQVAFLRELGCDEGQGYLFAAAAPPAECPAFACRLGMVNVSA